MKPFGGNCTYIPLFRAEVLIELRIPYIYTCLNNFLKELSFVRYLIMWFSTVSAVLLIVLTLHSRIQTTAAAPLRNTPSVQSLATDAIETMKNIINRCSLYVNQSRMSLTPNGNAGNNLNFHNLTLEQLHFPVKRTTDRLKIHCSALTNFSTLLRTITRQARRNSPRRNLTTMLTQVQINLCALRMTFRKILRALGVQCPINAASSSFSVAEMDRITEEFLRRNHTRASITSSVIRNYRDLAFVSSLLSTVATIKYDFHLLSLI